MDFAPKKSRIDAVYPNLRLLLDSTAHQNWSKVVPSQTGLQAVREAGSRGCGGTDCSLPMQYAMQNKLEVDTFIVGGIVELGSGVPESRLDERVIVNLVEYDENDSTVITGGIGSARAGGYAEYVAVRSVNAYAIDSPLSDAELATFPCAYLTAENMLDAAGVKEGETVLVPGASGGVGSALLQLVAARGARAVAVASSAKLRQVRTLEPFAAVARDEGDLIDSVREAIGGEGVEVATDVVGGPQFSAVLALLSWGGRYVTSGAIAGPVVDLDLRTVYLKRLRMIGVSLGLARHFETVLAHIQAGRIKPLLAATYPLADLKQAQTDFLGKQFFGNLVVVPRGVEVSTYRKD